MLRRDSPRASEGELAALADGSLAGPRRARVEAAVRESPELQALVHEQRHALSAMRAAAVSAPSGLRARLAGAPTAAPAARRRRFAPALVATCVVAAAVALAVGLGTIGPGAPTAAQAAQLASRPSTTAAPAGNRAAVLPVLRAAGLPYPYWEDRFGWRASGVRRDSLSGRPTTTVFYRRAGQRIAYTIVPGPALSTPVEASVTFRSGTRVTIFRSNGATVAIWLRRGHTCVLSGANVPSGVLVALAAFRSHGAIPY